MAVIGSGISGLSISYILSSSNIKVDLFENADKLGIDQHSMDFGTRRIDSPPRTFSAPFYGNLLAMYKDAGVDIKESLWNYTMAIMGQDSSYFKTGHRSLFSYRLPSVGASLFSLQSLKIIYDGYRFGKSIRARAHSEEYSKITLGEYLMQGRYSTAFIHGALLPILSMICTCSYEACLNYPVDVIMRYMAVTGTKGQFATKYGTRDAAEKLSKHVEKVHLSSRITGVWHATKDEKAKLMYVDADGVEREQSYDHIIISSQASAALTMLKDPTETETEALSMFKHEYSRVSVHQDPALMPARKENWSPLNFIMAKDGNSAMTTLWANEMLQLDPEVGDIFQSWNPIVPVDPTKELKSVKFERPIMTVDSLTAINRLRSCQGHKGIWFCGAYASYTLPLQESCVEAAIDVAEKLGVDCSWKVPRWYDAALTSPHPPSSSYFNYVAIAIAAASGCILVKTIIRH